MAYTYTPTQQIEAARNRISTNDAVAETALSSMLAMAQSEQFAPQAVTNPNPTTETEQPEKANFFQRLLETSLDWFKSVSMGLGKAFEGVVDFGAGAVGTVAGWFGNEELKNSASDFVATDYVGGWVHELEEHAEFLKFSNSFINDMSEKGQRIVRGVGEGVGQMLPLVALTVATGGVAAPAAAGTATASATAAGATAAQAAVAGAKAAKTISTIGKVVNMGLLGASAAGTGTEQALNYEIVGEDGTTRRPTLDRAFLYGLASGAVEMATETLVGGAYSKVFGGGVADKIINKLAKSTGFSKAVSFALNSLGEGAEEVVSEAVSNTLQTIYNSEEGFHWKNPNVQDMFEAGVIGTITSAVMSGGDVAVRKMSNKMSVQDHVAEARDIERKLENLSAQESLDQETATKLQASYQKNIDAIVKRYGMASDKTKASIFKSTPGIGAYINEDGTRRTVELDEGAQAITSEESSSPALSQALLSRTNEVANRLHAHGTTIAKNLTSDEIANTRKLRTALKKAGTDTGASIKVVVADNLGGANAFIDGDIMYISKERVGEVASTAHDFAHESSHFAEGTEEHEKLAQMLQKSLVSVEDKQVSLWDVAIQAVYKNTTANGRVDGYQISQETVDAFRKGSPEGLTEQQQKEWKLLYSEVVAKGSELVFGNQKYINELVESDRSLAKAWLKRIKRTIEIVKATFEGDKGTASSLKWLQKAEHTFESALAASGEKYLRGKMGARKDEDDIDKNGETEYNKRVHYISYDKIGIDVVKRIKDKVNVLYGDIENGIANGIAIEDGITVYIVDTGNDDGNLSIGFRTIHTITDVELRKEFIRRTNNDAVAKGYISDGLSTRIGNGYVDDRVRYRRWEVGQERQTNSGEPEHNKSSLSQSNEYGRRGVNNTDDTQKSLADTDSQGNKLSEEQQRFFADSKVRDKDGNLLVVYHGSPNQFFTFDRDRVGKGTDQYGAGFYFSTNEDTAQGYGKNVHKTYLDIRKPIVIKQSANGGDPFDFSISTKQSYEILKRHPLIYDSENSPLGDIFEEFWEIGAKDFMIREMARNYTNIGLLDSDYLAFRDYPNELHEAVREVLGYDGIQVNFENKDEKFFIAWFENQIKLTTNMNPTADNDIRYSLSIDGDTIEGKVEETKNLVALHNLEERNLLRVLELGGFPMPSIAVTTTELPHNNYGDITVIFGRDTIDPEIDKRNVVYDRDAWTPTAPKVEVKLNNKSVDTLIEDLQKLVGENSAYKSDINKFFEGKYSNGSGEYVVSDFDYSKKTIGEYAIRNCGLVAAYLSEKGKNVEPIFVEKGFLAGWTSYSRQEASELLDYLGITKDVNRDNITQKQRTSIFEKYIEYTAKKKYELLKKRKHGITLDKCIEIVRRNNDEGKVYQLLIMAEDFYNENRPKDVFDESATLEKLQSEIGNKEDFYTWIWNKIEATFDKKGIDNDSDIFDRYGNRRSFEQRHYAYTVNNIVKAMLKGDQEGRTTFGMTSGALAAKLSRQFSSIEDIRAAKEYLALVSEDDLKAFSNKTYELYDELVTCIAGKPSDPFSYTESSRRDDVGDILGKCAAVKPLTVENIKRKFASETRGYNLGYKFNDEIANMALSLFESLKHMPTTYFEAKPRRTVGFDEIKSVLLPEDSSDKLKTALTKKDINWQIYGEGENARAEIIREMDDIRFNLSDTDIGKKPTFTGQQAKTIANNSRENVYSRQDAEEVITAIVSEKFMLEDEGKYGVLKGKGKEEVVDYLFRKLNSQDNNKGRGAVALEIADYLIDTVTMMDIDADDYDKSEDLNTLQVLRQFIHKMDLSGIRGEIKHKYGSNNAIYLVWGAQKGEVSVAPDKAAQLLEHFGMQFKSTNEADLFFEMVDKYESARDNIKKSIKKQKLKDFEYEGNIKDLRQEIAREVLLAYDQRGEKSKYATEVLDKIEDLKAEIRKVKKEAYEYNKIVNRILDIAEELKPNSDRHRVDGSILEDPTFNDVMKNLSKLKYRSDIRKSKARTILASLKLWYNKANPLLNGNVEKVDAILEKEGTCGYLNSYILEILDEFDENQSSKKPLSLDEAKAALMVMEHVIHLVKSYNQVFIGERTMRLSAAADKSFNVALKYTDMHKKGKTTELLRKYGYNIVEPRVVLADWFGYENNPFMQAFDAITAGETKAGLVTLELLTPIDEFMRDHRKYRNRLANDKITVCGHDITVGAAISLYMLANQQASIAGLEKNGWGYYDKNGYWVNCGILTGADVYSLEESFSQADKDFIKVIRKVLDKSGEYMKETNLIDMGFSMINTENSDYFPIRRYEGDFARNVEQSFQGYIMANLSVAKARVKNQRRIAVYDVISILENHAKQVGLYTGLAVPIKEFQRVYNINITNGSVPTSLRNILNEEIWKDAGKYITNLLSDIQGMNGVKSNIDKFVDKVRSGYVKFQLGANIKVIFSQAASYPTAFTDLSLESLTKAFTKKLNFKDMDEHCPWTRVRNADSGIVRAESLTDKVGAVGDALTKPIQWMDRATIGMLWNACQFEVERRHKGDASFKFGTEQNKTEAGKLLESVGRRTQPNYTASERSALQRSKSHVAKTLSMFSSVPLKQFSRLYEALGKERALKYRKNRLGEKVSDAELKAAHLYTAKAITAVTVANLVYVAMGEAIKFLLNKDRKDEEGNEIGLLEDFIRDFMSTTVGMFPIVKDLYNAIVNGFSNEDFVSSALKSFTETTREIYDGAVLLASGEPIEDKDIAGPIRSFAYALGQLTGIPTRNAYNLVYGLIKRFDPAKAYEMNSIFYSNASYTRDLKSAVEKGDENKATTIIGLMLKDDGMTSTSPKVNEKLRTLYEAGFSVLPRTVKDTIAYDGEVIELSRSSQKAFKEVYGQANNEVESLVKSKAFTGLSDEVQAKAIKWIYDYYYEKAVTETLGAEANSKRQLFGETMAPSKFAMAFAACSAVESKVDRKGNTIAGSKRTAVTKLLNQLSLTKAEKAIILAYLGYSVEDYETLIKSFISRIGLTRTQQKAFLKYANL